MSIGEGSSSDQLRRLQFSHHNADLPFPAIIDATGASAQEIRAARPFPVITYVRVSDAIAPTHSVDAHLTVPEHLAPALERAVRRNPLTAVILAQLVGATHHLDVAPALAMESVAYSALQGGREYHAWIHSRERTTTPPNSAARLRVFSEAHSVVIELTRPDKANALDAQARHELVDTLTALAISDMPIVMRGAGNHFCTGGDLDEFSLPDDPTVTHAIRLRQGVAAAFAQVADRLTVEVHGGVIGAGLELAAFARRVTARPNAKFRLPEVRMGLVPGSGGTVSVPRRIGPNRALILMLTGRVLSAEDALAWGLIDEVIP